MAVGVSSGTGWSIAAETIGGTQYQQVKLIDGLVGATLPIQATTATAADPAAGGMAAECGIVYESMKYAANFGLPVVWVVEDNGESVGSKTAELWKIQNPMLPDSSDVYEYHYKNRFPHVGTGHWVTF